MCANRRIVESDNQLEHTCEVDPYVRNSIHVGWSIVVHMICTLVRAMLHGAMFMRCEFTPWRLPIFHSAFV